MGEGEELAEPEGDYERPSWQELSNCVGVDPDVFFPDDGDYDEARGFCGGCVVRASCLAHALKHGIRQGMWGGTSPEQRRKIKRSRRHGT